MCSSVLINPINVTVKKGKLLPDILPGSGRCARIQAKRMFGIWRNLDLSKSKTADRLVRPFTTRRGSVSNLSH